LLANEAHLFAVSLVSRDTPHLVADRRSDAAAGSGLAEGRAYSFGIRHAIRADDVKRRGRGFVQPNVK
jgi:hypothetical protein